MADCESCKNYDRPTICTTCENGSDFERILQTNADRIRSMSDEELAEFFARKSPCTHYCNYIGKTCQGVSCKQGILEWLQSEAE